MSDEHAPDEAVGDAQDAAREARSAEAGAVDAKASAEQARDASVRAATGATEAAAVVAPDDPLLDTAVRRIEAQVSDEKPFGEPGRPMSRRSPFRVAFTASLGVALAYGLVQALVTVRSVLILLLVSGFLAIGLNPTVEFFERRGIARGRAVGIVLAGVLVFFTAFFAAIVPPIVDQAGQFREAVPGYVQDLQDNRRIADLNEQYGFLEKAKDLAKNPEKLAPSVFGGVVGVGKVVFSAFFSALTVLILTLYFLSSLPSIKQSAYRMVPRSRRARVGLLTDEILSRVGGYVAGALTIGAIAGVTTFVFCMAFGIPYPVALAMVVAVTDLVPLIGATIGAAVVTLVAFFVSVEVGLIALVYYLVYQQVENYVLYPRIMKRSVDVSPAATVVAVLIGGSLLGVLGALLAIPIAAAVQLVLQQVVAPRQDDH
ncbi:MAG: AI-2E family transporter [Mycobacteriales bacterium]|nr:AI-2E family transporter [Mycobacteriales bacterium]